MVYYPWSIPDEAVAFIYDQFTRFNQDPPEPKVIEAAMDHAFIYVGEHNYFPKNYPEALERYNRPGLTEPEKYVFLGVVERKVKLHLRLNPTFDQLHIVAWAALMYCWSGDGAMKHIQQYNKMGEQAL